VWHAARCTPDIAPPVPRDWRPDEALAEILRGRLEGLGPVTSAALAAPLGLEPDEIGAALTALEVEGFALRGRFTSGTNQDEWCDRRLLARIHHYTIRRLRAEIEPVAARDFLRFLFAWQRVTDETRQEGPESVAATVALLEGFEAPAGAWETELLPARIAEYEPTWLDDQCLAGRIAWARLAPVARGRAHALVRGGANAREPVASPVRTTPVTLLTRRHLPLWTALSGPAEDTQPSPRALAVANCLRARGASFFDELIEATGLLRPQVEAALGELVALGMVTSDSFGGLRALLVPADRRKSLGGTTRRRRRALNFDMDDAGRWSLARRAAESETQGQMPGATEHVARALLRRYGIVFWRLLAREADWLPPWRDLLRVYRRMEARGDNGSARRCPWRTFCCRILRRAIRAARGNREAARSSAPTGRRGVDLGIRRGSAQPRRHHDARSEAVGADRESSAVPRRVANRVPRGECGAVSGNA
jgi:ATP-dependent Lhr-like helicase